MGGWNGAHPCWWSYQLCCLHTLTVTEGAISGWTLEWGRFLQYRKWIVSSRACLCFRHNRVRFRPYSSCNWLRQLALASSFRRLGRKGMETKPSLYTQGGLGFHCHCCSLPTTVAHLSCNPWHVSAQNMCSPVSLSSQRHHFHHAGRMHILQTANRMPFSLSSRCGANIQPSCCQKSRLGLQEQPSRGASSFTQPSTKKCFSFLSFLDSS